MGIKKILKFLLPHLLRDKKTTAAYFICMLFAWGFGLVLPYISGVYIDHLVVGADIPIILTFVIVVAVLNLFTLINEGIHSAVGTAFNNKLYYNLGVGTILQVLKAKLSKYQNEDKGTLLGLILDESKALLFFVSNASINILLRFGTIIVSGVIIFTADILMGIIIFALIPIYIAVYLFFRKGLSETMMASNLANNAFFSARAEQLNRVEFIKRNSVLPEVSNQLGASFGKMLTAAIKATMREFFFRTSGKFASAVCQVIVFGLGGYRVYTGNISIGMFTILTVYFSMVVSSVDYYMNLAANYQGAKISVERLGKIFDAELEINGDKSLEQLNKINLLDLSFKYDRTKETKVFNHLNYVFEKGKIYAIRGENGAGKSTLLNCIMGLYTDVFTGQILFDNTPLNEINIQALRRSKISFVEQAPEFFNLTIGEYLRFGIDTSEQTESARSQLMCAFELDKFSQDININASGNNFSGGERQKLSLTRVLSKESFLTILDEPTSALDNASVETLAKILQEQKNTRITILVSHDHRILDLCDEVLNISVESAKQ